ncbi:MAG: CotH kinase family protein [Lachnospiraceae bacterium]|nr:CotH kinase family protein [Lachnospiraceae bacterium]
MQKKRRASKMLLLTFGMACFMALAGCNGGQSGTTPENGSNLENSDGSHAGVGQVEPTATPKPTITPTPTLLPTEEAAARQSAVNKLMVGMITPETIRNYSVLPVLELTVENRIGDIYETGTMVLSDVSEQVLYEGALEIKLRGNSTRYLNKRPYKIKLESKSDLFGMGKNKHWVLLANDIDHTLIRNKITLDFAGAIGMKFASESQLVSVFLNGNYQGVYQLCEHIRVGKERVNIFDWEDYFLAEEWSEDLDMKKEDYEEAANTPQTGGFLLEADFYAFTDSKASKVVTNFRQPFYFNTPEVVPEDSKLYNYTKNYIQSFEYALHSEDYIYNSDDKHYSAFGIQYDGKENGWFASVSEVDYTDPTFDGYHYSGLFDMDSLVQNFMICELTMNWDSMKNSTFLYKDIEGPAYMGPVWDYDWAYGNINMYRIDTYITDDWHTTNNYFTREQFYQSVQWNRYLIKDPYFLMKVYEKYKSIRQNELKDFLDSLEYYQEFLKFDGALNDKRWGYGGRNGEKYAKATDSLQNFIYDRVAWLDRQFVDFETLVDSLGYYEPSPEALHVEKVEAGATEYVITVAVDGVDAAVVEYQINGVNVVRAAAVDGVSTVTVPAEWFTDGLDMIHVRPVQEDGSYYYSVIEKEALPISNYYLFD